MIFILNIVNNQVVVQSAANTIRNIAMNEKNSLSRFVRDSPDRELEIKGCLATVTYPNKNSGPDYQYGPGVTEYARKLAAFLKNDKTISELTLSMTRCSVSDLVTIFKGLEKNTTLSSIVLNLDQLKDVEFFRELSAELDKTHMQIKLDDSEDHLVVEIGTKSAQGFFHALGVSNGHIRQAVREKDYNAVVDVCGKFNRSVPPKSQCRVASSSSSTVSKIVNDGDLIKKPTKTQDSFPLMLSNQLSKLQPTHFEDMMWKKLNESELECSNLMHIFETTIAIECARLQLKGAGEKALSVSAEAQLVSVNEGKDEFIKSFRSLVKLLNANRSYVFRWSETKGFENFKAVMTAAVTKKSDDSDVDLLARVTPFTKEWSKKGGPGKVIQDEIKRLDEAGVKSKANAISTALREFEQHSDSPAYALLLKHALNMHQDRFTLGMDANAWLTVKNAFERTVESRAVIKP